MARYVVGIDLGTTHCAVAYSPIGQADVRLFAVPQLVAAGEVADRPLLPSFLYLPAPGEVDPEAARLPWGEGTPVAGEWARRLGAATPNRLVASAKSWICHGGVNRRAPILPWSAPDGEPHVSPFEAQVRYLEHLRRAWDQAFPAAPLADQDVVVTVPASFDEVARELTADAAAQAGLRQVRLLEEPQAAFYDFLGAHTDALGEALGAARLVLVVDVGGGTTDLTLVRVHPPATPGADPTLERVAVGGHLMLGGDNMDAALAHHVLERVGGGTLDPTEWSALIQACRAAKERLLADDAPDQVPVTLQRRGSRLIGGTRTVPLRRSDVEQVLVDGFLPFSGREEVASRQGRAGLTTLGLPYVTDPAIPRHVATFLRRHATAAAEAGAEVRDGLPRPDLLLLNGGVFNAPALITRLQAVLAGWYGAPVPLLAHSSLDTAVARGAARSALARHGVGPAIAGGQARACYIGVQGPDGQPQALCVAPRGLEEGATVAVEGRVFQLVVGRPVAFPLFQYSGDRADAVGAVVPVDDELEPLPALETALKRQGGMWVDPETGAVPVRLSATLTEVGTLELFLVTVELPPRRWQLEFALSDDAPPPAEPEPPVEEAAPEPLPPRFGEARRLVERIYGSGKVGADPAAARSLREDLEKVLGPRGEWSLTVCRSLHGVLHDVRGQRGRSAMHELTWLRLASWCLRPGFGFQGDAARVDATWALHTEGPKFPKDKAIQAEWWILWRRIAGGLDARRQAALLADVRPAFVAEGGPPLAVHPEMLRMLAALERLPAPDRQRAGEWFLASFKKVNSWWPLGRFGARESFHGGSREAVPPAVAEAWLRLLLDLDWAQADGAAFAAVMIARVTGDPGRDVSEASRRAVMARLGGVKGAGAWLPLLERASALSEGDRKRVFGEGLPAGLRL
ncbi:MAG: Hsp70 family protein [Myxococcales bacterium]|nr:Hsp70 family protein [Myxococcales bacterium]